jgi:hypothetical protein
MNITKILTLLFIFLFKEPLYSQIKVEGYIVDDQRQPIEFVSIHSRRTLLSTVTDQKVILKLMFRIAKTACTLRTLATDRKYLRLTKLQLAARL